MPTRLLTRGDRAALTDVSRDEVVALFPSLAHWQPETETWNIEVHGEVFSRGRVGIGKRLLLKMLQRAMRVPASDFDTDLFRERIDRFLAIDHHGRQLGVRIGDDVHLLAKRSRRNGHFQGSIEIGAHALPPIEMDPTGAPTSMTLEILRPDGNSPAALGQVFLMPTTGVSVISDIDDTLKHSHVACKRTLLKNTFLNEFQSIEGMADIFCRWSQAGAAFHYVSSSPWQLYRHLAEHLHDEGFPYGSYHLRAFRLRDHLIRRLLMLRRSGKAATIRGLLKRFPQRQFLLVGDSGEADPEIYGAMARKFPRQIAGIYIREMDAPKARPKRYAKAFRGVPYDVVRLFHDADELSDAWPF